MNRSHLQIVLLADAPEALVELCGISLLERKLRILQRLGFSRAILISATPQAIRGELAIPSWARDNIHVDVVPRDPGPITGEMLRPHLAPEAKGYLVIPGGIYCDARLLAALADQDKSTVLVDSRPADSVRPLLQSLPATSRGTLCGPAMLTKDFAANSAPNSVFVDSLRDALEKGTIEVMDAATQPTYIASMRRQVRPHCFPAPPPEQQRAAERVILDTAQNGTLDIPAYLHAPIETWIVSRLCKTLISPNQITVAGLVLGIIVTVAFSTGHLLLGTLLALVFGVVDGLDGKQARTKIETTERGKWEHQLDYIIETSWWAALAFFLWRSGQLPAAFYFFWLLIGADLLDRLLKGRTRKMTGRQLDDLTTFDRLFRLIGGRRNIYVWMLAIGLALGNLAQIYPLICGWAAVTVAVHLLRFLGIRRNRDTEIPASGA